MIAKNSYEKIYVTKPSLPPFEEYVRAIEPLWESRALSNMGVYHRQLEEKLQEYLNARKFSLTVNGHMALELTIQAFDFLEESEIITTPFTFISTTHAIVRNHLKPVFCDVKLEDGTIDETKIEGLITEHTRAIVPVHVYGNVCNVEEIQHIAEKYSLKVIYDAAHAFGVRYKGIGIGSYGDASIFSFHATKVFHTVEGGGTASSDEKLYERLYNLKNFGIRGEELVVETGANAKMNELSAIMGICNLKYIDKSIAERKKWHDLYIEKLFSVPGIGFFDNKNDVEKNYAYFPVLIKDEYPLSRNEIYDLLKKHGIYSRKYFYPLTCDQACFQNKYKNSLVENARKLADQVLVLPLYEDMTEESIEIVTDILKTQKSSLR